MRAVLIVLAALSAAGVLMSAALHVASLLGVALIPVFGEAFWMISYAFAIVCTSWVGFMMFDRATSRPAVRMGWRWNLLLVGAFAYAGINLYLSMRGVPREGGWVAIDTPQLQAEIIRLASGHWLVLCLFPLPYFLRRAVPEGAP